MDVNMPKGGLVKKLFLTGCFSFVSLIVSLISSYIPWYIKFLNIDYSLFFVLVGWGLIDYKLTLLTLVIKFLLQPLFYRRYWFGVLSSFASFLAQICFVFLIKKGGKKDKLGLPNIFFSIILTSILMTLVNYLFFVPFFFYINNYTTSPTIKAVNDVWENRGYIFSLNPKKFNYFSTILISFFFFNFVNLTVNALIFKGLKASFSYWEDNR